MKQLRNAPLKNVNLAGMFMAVYIDDGQAVFFKLDGVYFLPIFSTPEKAAAALKEGGTVGATKIQIITDHKEFLASVAGKVRLMLNPWRTDRGTTRFTEILILPANIGETN